MFSKNDAPLQRQGPFGNLGKLEKCAKTVPIPIFLVPPPPEPPTTFTAAVGTPCLAVFSGRNQPGIWFPHGKQHKVIYHKTECFGCELDVCVQHQKKCIRSISADEVFEAAAALLAGKRNET